MTVPSLSSNVLARLKRLLGDLARGILFLRHSLPPWDSAWSRKQKGRWGERAAERYLWSQHGHRILARNVTCNDGEIDLVTDDHGTIVFVEVKTRLEPERNPPLPAVDEEKMARLLRAARRYLQGIRPPRPPARIDLVGVVPDPQTGAPRVSHVSGAARISDRPR